jgi:hypothetical protein
VRPFWSELLPTMKWVCSKWVERVIASFPSRRRRMGHYSATSSLMSC